VLYEVQDKLTEATDVLESGLEKLLARKVDCPDVYIRLGSLYEHLGEHDVASHAYKEGKKLGLKLRPAVCLRKLPPTYREFLVCGVSSQVARVNEDLDEIVRSVDDGLRLNAKESVIRLGFLGRVRVEEIVGRIGSITAVRHRRLLKKLGEYLVKVEKQSA
jgi:mRNA interferase MazF